MDPSDLEKWTRLFSEFGPFFISLLMLLFLPSASKALREAVAKGDAKEARFRRQVYVSIWGFAGLLILISVVWWLWLKQPHSYFIRFDISEAQPTDVFAPDSDELYYRNRDVNDADRRRDSFVAVSEKPFQLDQELTVVHKKGFDALKGLKYAVKLDASVLRDRRASYRLVFKEGNYALEPVRAAKAAEKVVSIIATAHAGNAGPSSVPAKPWYPAEQSPSVGRQSIQRSMPPLPAVGTEALAQRLLDEKAGLSEQIEALDALTVAARSGRPIDLFQVKRSSKGAGASDESLLSYLLTLARHEDRLVAFKAKDLLKHVEYLEVVGRIATGESRVDPPVQRRVLAALSATDWDALERHLSKGATGSGPKVNRVGYAGASPLPSASADGTQYWGITHFQGLSNEQKTCLAGVVYRQNYIPAAQVSDARGFIDSLREYTFVFGTKSETVLYAEAASKCGARTEFLYRTDKRIATLK